MKKTTSCHHGKSVEHALRRPPALPHATCVLFCPDLPPNPHLPQRTLGNISNNFSAASSSFPPLHSTHDQIQNVRRRRIVLCSRASRGVQLPEIELPPRLQCRVHVLMALAPLARWAGPQGLGPRVRAPARRYLLEGHAVASRA